MWCYKQIFFGKIPLREYDGEVTTAGIIATPLNRILAITSYAKFRSSYNGNIQDRNHGIFICKLTPSLMWRTTDQLVIQVQRELLQLAVVQISLSQTKQANVTAADWHSLLAPCSFYGLKRGSFFCGSCFLFLIVLNSKVCKMEAWTYSKQFISIRDCRALSNELSTPSFQNR